MQDYQVSAQGLWEDSHFIGGHVACDFANTVSDRVKTNRAEERFASPEQVESWCRSHHLVVPKGTGWISPDHIAALQELRDVGYGLLCKLIEGEAPSAADLSRVLKSAASLSIKPAVSGEGRTVFDLQKTVLQSGEDLPGLLALYILDLIYTADRHRLRRCSRCGWLFYDRSKSARRRWCSMKSCGNREKAKRHYQQRVSGFS